MHTRLQKWLYARGDRHNTRWFPELNHVKSVDGRAKLWRLCYWRYFRRRWLSRGVLLLVISLVLQGAARLAAWPLLTLAPTISEKTLGLLTAGVAGGATGLSLLVIIRRDMQRELRWELNRRGTVVCMRCGYDLRGQVEPRCPECGTPFDDKLLTEKN